MQVNQAMLGVFLIGLMLGIVVMGFAMGAVVDTAYAALRAKNSLIAKLRRQHE